MQNSNIRRIDELGRIVIPKDIRKKLHIKDNEPLEIFIENDTIRIKKYSSMPDIIEYIKYLVDMGNRITKNKYIITDREKIIASTDEKLESLSLNTYLEDLVLNSKELSSFNIETSLSNINIKAIANITPIIIDNDRSGIIIEYSDTNPGSPSTIKIFKNLIEKNLNNYWFLQTSVLYLA